VTVTFHRGAQIVGLRTLEQLGRWRGYPQAIRCDNGPEIRSQVFVDWCDANDVESRYIQPGKPDRLYASPQQAKS
jgi:hypothetical protein